ncbi:sigma-70 family RNA polymerase sigma factor [Saprospiraceae bacterium]|nr:sigma-70 family RNA polymerase sigma factor [Saprospiraceae bacterium]
MKKEITYNQLEALKHGDSDILKVIYTQYHSVIYYYTLKFIQLETMAEEATADVFITLWKRRAVIDSNLPIQAFLYKIAKDMAYNYLKKIASANRLKQQYLENYPVLELKNGEALLLEKEKMTLISHVIETLPPKRLEIFKMRYYEGLDNNTIAKRLGISINTVKAHLAKARLNLKDKLSNEKELEFMFSLMAMGFFII